MASSGNLGTIEPWTTTFRTPFADNWFSDAFSPDNETLTRALQRSISNQADSGVGNDVGVPFFNVGQPDPLLQPTGSVSDAETAVSKRQNSIPVKRTKRKRPSKGAATNTTFITADPENFREMVQQVTGVRFCGVGGVPFAPLLKPEPQRGAVGRMQGCLPTLDTSAFLLHHHQHQIEGSTAANVQTAAGLHPGASGGGAELPFDSFSSFPTLESWKVM